MGILTTQSSASKVFLLPFNITKLAQATSQRGAYSSQVAERLGGLFKNA
jgi:hypothetical protein